MSKIFYDHFIKLEEVEVEFDKLEMEPEEREEIEHLIEEMIHHRVMDRLLTYLPKHHHAEFLDRFHKMPYDESLIRYLDEKIEKTVKEHVEEEMEKLKREILEDLEASKKK